MARSYSSEYAARNAAARSMGFDNYSQQRAARETYKAAHGEQAPKGSDIIFFARDLTKRRSSDREIRRTLRINPSDRDAWTRIFSP